jgi:organic hydroperoxide reductase OsmC/OhrA
MQDYPHIYKAAASAKNIGEVQVTSPGLEAIATTSPPEFGGPEGTWSPETLLVASIADCFNLTFRAIARASKFDWYELECEAEGKLEKFNSITRFTFFNLKATLQVPEGSMKAKAERLLQMAENNCLITNSLAADIHLESVVEEVADQRVA